MQLYFLLKFFAVGIGLLVGLLLASGVDRISGRHGLAALASLTLLATAVLSMG